MQSDLVGIHTTCLCKCPEVCAMEVKGVPNCPWYVQFSLLVGLEICGCL